MKNKYLIIAIVLLVILGLGSLDASAAQSNVQPQGYYRNFFQYLLYLFFHFRNF